eukprot:1946432-Pleurochrysis_carterae.AAC.1
MAAAGAGVLQPASPGVLARVSIVDPARSAASGVAASISLARDTRGGGAGHALMRLNDANVLERGGQRAETKTGAKLQPRSR